MGAGGSDEPESAPPPFVVAPLPAAALFEAGNVAVGALPPEASSEVKRYIYSTRFRFAVQLSDMGGSRIFIGEGLQVLGYRFGH